jgi:hypothetical protein
VSVFFVFSLIISIQNYLKHLRNDSRKPNINLNEGDWMKIAAHLNRVTKEKLNYIGKSKKNIKKLKRASKKPKEEKVNGMI